MPDQTQFEYEAPVRRQLQMFSLDPAADVSMDTATISRCMIDIPWEELRPGPSRLTVLLGRCNQEQHSIQTLDALRAEAGPLTIVLGVTRALAASGGRGRPEADRCISRAVP